MQALLILICASICASLLVFALACMFANQDEGDPRKPTWREDWEDEL